MKHLVEEAGRADEFLIDSAGILSYHQGELPDSRMRAHAARRGYNLTHLSRPVRTEDFYNFDLIIGMDDRNIDDLKDRAPLPMPTMYRTPITAVPKVLSMCWTFWKMLVRGYCRAFNPAALHGTASPAVTSCSVFQAS